MPTPPVQHLEPIESTELPVRLKNVFVVGLNDFNRKKLESIENASGYRFHGLLTPDEILEADSFPIESMLSRAEERLRSFDGDIDGLIGYMDFPVSTMLPILAQKMGLRALSLDSLFKCEHKYWSRLEQRKVIPDHIPQFQLIDPFVDNPAAQLELPFPFWLKPVKSAGSYLGFRIDDAQALEQALEEIRMHIGRFAEPFEKLLDYAELPEEIARVGGHACLAESLLSGELCTVEGYVYDHQVHVYGVIDSIREANGSSFARYQYPSQLPEEVCRSMHRIAETILTHIGFNDSAFNIEFFWDRDTNQIGLLEINTRVAQHHSDLFEKVHGVSNHQIAVNIAVGEPPAFPSREGPFACAAAYFLRHYQDALVVSVPSQEALARVQADWPGTFVELDVKPGVQLSQLHDQDSYSYVLALIYVGAESHQALADRYQQIIKQLVFELAPITE